MRETRAEEASNCKNLLKLNDEKFIIDFFERKRREEVIAAKTEESHASGRRGDYLNFISAILYDSE
jgi:hypothetical protein